MGRLRSSPRRRPHGSAVVSRACSARRAMASQASRSLALPGSRSRRPPSGVRSNQPLWQPLSAPSLSSTSLLRALRIDERSRSRVRTIRASAFCLGKSFRTASALSSGSPRLSCRLALTVVTIAHPGLMILSRQRARASRVPSPLRARRALGLSLIPMHTLAVRNSNWPFLVPRSRQPP
jgi:hypothetical protein